MVPSPRKFQSSEDSHHWKALKSIKMKKKILFQSSEDSHHWKDNSNGTYTIYDKTFKSSEDSHHWKGVDETTVPSRLVCFSHPKILIIGKFLKERITLRCLFVSVIRRFSSLESGTQEPAEQTEPSVSVIRRFSSLESGNWIYLICSVLLFQSSEDSHHWKVPSMKWIFSEDIVSVIRRFSSLERRCQSPYFW